MIWRIITEEYGPDIEYIKGEKKIVVYAISILPLNGNEATTQKSTYQNKIVSEIDDIEELPEVTFPINLKLIQICHREEPSIKAKYKNVTYHKGSFRGCGNIDINLIMCEDKIVIPKKLQSYVSHWLNTYIIHPGMYRTETII